MARPANEIPLDEIYVADFETRAGEQAQLELKTWVWAWAITKITNFDEVEVGNTISSFFSKINNGNNKIIYFHNLGFDGMFIFDYLLKNEKYEFVHARELKIGQFSTLMDDMKKIYNIKVRISKCCTIEFRDSFKKIPAKVERIAEDFKTKYKKLEIDYIEERPEDYIMTKEEEEYVKNDVRVVAEALLSMYKEGYDSMTIGGDALKVYKNMFGNNGKSAYKFRTFFPVLSKEEDAFVRKAYRGGWTYLKDGMAGKFKNVYHYDVCSLYPSNMSSNEYYLKNKKYKNMYPIGSGNYFVDEIPKSVRCPLFVVRILCRFDLKEGYLPTIQAKGNYLFRQNEYLKTSKVIDKNGFIFDEPMELYLTSVDFELFLEHYNVEYKVIDGYAYEGCYALFDEYINFFIEIKNNAKGAKRQIAKLFLNNLYGKFASGIETAIITPYIRDLHVAFDCIQGEDKKPVYTPVGAFITAYSRRFTITTAQENYNTFIYSDTDSLFLLEPMKGGEIHGKKLLTWSDECVEEINECYEEAIFIGQKRYAKKTKGEWKIVCAGMSGSTAKKFINGIQEKKYTIDDFKIGLKIPASNLKKKTVEGGVILFPQDFELKSI